VNRGERLALRHYRLRGYRLLASNARVGRYELDLVLRRGRRILVVEVKEKTGEVYGHPLEMVDDEKARRVLTAAAGVWVFSNIGQVYMTYLYQIGWRFFQMGYASAMAWVFLLSIGFITVVLFRTGRFWVHYSDAEER